MASKSSAADHNVPRAVGQFWKFARWVAAGLIALALVSVATIVYFQEYLLFPYYAQTSWKAESEREEPLIPNVERVMLGEAGQRIEVWLQRPKGEARGVAIVFRANLGSLADHESLIDWAAAHGFVGAVFNYPGMGLSDGIPTERSILESGERVYGYLQSEFQSPEGRNWVMGYSIGTGPAGIFAAKHNPDLLTLFAPYTDLADVVRSHRRFGLLIPFLRFRAPLAVPISSLKKTDFIVATGGSDTTVLPEISAEVFKYYRGAGRSRQVQNPSGTHDRLLGANRTQLDQVLAEFGY